MSIETQLAELTTNVGNLVNRVTTQADNWDARVNAAKTQIDEYIANAKYLSYNIEDNSFTVGGNANTYYPILFLCPYRTPIELTVYRKVIHYNQPDFGSLFFKCAYFSSVCGNGSEWYKILVNRSAVRYFIADYYFGFVSSYIILYLLGGNVTYDWQCSVKSVTVNYEATQKVINYDDPNLQPEVFNPITTINPAMQTQIVYWS